jgi:hypothetical protein
MLGEWALDWAAWKPLCAALQFAASRWPERQARRETYRPCLVF